MNTQSIVITLDQVKDFSKTSSSEYFKFAEWVKQNPLYCKAGQLTSFFEKAIGLPTITVEAWLNSFNKANSEIQNAVDPRKVINILYKGDYPISKGHVVYEYPRITFEFLGSDGNPQDILDGFLSGGRHRFVAFVTYAHLSGIDLDSPDFLDALIPCVMSRHSPEIIITNNTSRPMTATEKAQVKAVVSGLPADYYALLQMTHNKTIPVGFDPNKLMGLVGNYLAQFKSDELLTSIDVYAALYTRFYKQWLNTFDTKGKKCKFSDDFEKFHSVFLTLFDEINVLVPIYRAKGVSNLTLSKPQIGITGDLIAKFQKNKAKWESNYKLDSEEEIEEQTLENITDTLENLPDKSLIDGEDGHIIPVNLDDLVHPFDRKPNVKVVTETKPLTAKKQSTNSRKKKVTAI